MEVVMSVWTAEQQLGVHNLNLYNFYMTNLLQRKGFDENQGMRLIIYGSVFWTKDINLPEKYPNVIPISRLIEMVRDGTLIPEDINPDQFIEKIEKIEG